VWASSRIPNRARVRVPWSSGTQSTTDAIGAYWLTADFLPAGPVSQSDSKYSGKACAAKLLGPNGECLRLFLNAVMVDDNHIDAQSLRQRNFFLCVDSVVDRDQEVGAAQ